MKRTIYTIAFILLAQISFGQIKTIKVRGAGGGGATITYYGKNVTNDSTIIVLSNGTRFAAAMGSTGWSDSTIVFTDFPLQVKDSSWIVGPDTLHKYTIQFRSDSLVTKLDYVGDALDSSTYGNGTLIPKGYLNQRLASLPTGSGTVTSVGTGYGLSGGPITTTGTIVVDSAALSLKYLRIKDSTVAYVTPYQSSLKFNITDTTNKWVQSVVRKNDSTITVNKNGTASDITLRFAGGTDSLSYHSISVPSAPGDSVIIFNKPNGQKDTVGITLLQIWKKNGNKIYYSSGNVGLNTSNPINQFHVLRNSVAANDSSGIYLQNTDSTIGGTKTSPPLILGAAVNVAGTVTRKDAIWQQEVSSSGGNLKLYSRVNYGSYGSPLLTISTENGYITTPGLITSTGNGINTFNGGFQVYQPIIVTYSSTAGSTRYNYKADGTASTSVSGTLYNFASTSNAPAGATILIPFSNLYGNNLFNQTAGSSGIGVTAINASAKLEIADTTKGLLPPRMTTAQRDKIISSLTGSITAGGTGYANTTGSGFSLTGGSGSGATALVVVTAGVVTSVTITNPGIGYIVGNVLSITGTGTGFTYTLSAVGSPATGLLIYNTTSTKLNSYNGTNWIATGGFSGSYSASPTAVSTFTVTIGQTLPTNSYRVGVTSTSVLGAAAFYVTNKTTTTFDVTFLSALTGTLSFDWIISQQ